MRFDRNGHGWRPAHDRDARLGSSIGLILGLVLMVISAGVLLAVPGRDAPQRRGVAVALP
ncbi:MAG TPA: hypothetical protein VFL36_02440 [Myxococcales bacterium]|nr:hypothetical protein [Myxococcales bacterium]